MLERNDLVVNVTDEIKRLEAVVSRILPYVTDTVSYLSQEIATGSSVMLEGAQATMLDINHGTYPFVTSSSATAGGIALGLGIPPRCIERVIGVFKLPMTRVGKGPFTTRLTENENELHDILAGIKGSKGAEFGATTGRARDIGWMDLVMAKYAHMVNGFTDIGLTKLDMLSGIATLKIATSYTLDGREIHIMPADTSAIERCTPIYTELLGWDEQIVGVADFAQLPKNAQDYILFIEKFLGVPVTMIGTGPDNADLIKR